MEGLFLSFFFFIVLLFLASRVVFVLLNFRFCFLPVLSLVDFFSHLYRLRLSSFRVSYSSKFCEMNDAWMMCRLGWTICQLRWMICQLRWMICQLGWLMCRVGRTVSSDECQLAWMIWRFAWMICRFIWIISRINVLCNEKGRKHDISRS